MAFLTLIAPLVAVTYPIDKLNDGKAQAYDAWFKEYLFNLLIQPLHLLLYFILISSAAELANKYMIYSFVALAFMIPAEKLLRKFFGFEKAQTPGLLAGPAGGALMMSAIRSLGRFSHGSHGKPGTQSSSDKNSKNINGENNSKKPFFSSNMNAMETLNDALPNSESRPDNRNNSPLLNSDPSQNEGNRNAENGNQEHNNLNRNNSGEPVFENDFSSTDTNQEQLSPDVVGESNTNPLLTNSTENSLETNDYQNPIPEPRRNNKANEELQREKNESHEQLKQERMKAQEPLQRERKEAQKSQKNKGPKVKTNKALKNSTQKPKKKRIKGIAKTGLSMLRKTDKAVKFTGRKATQLFAGTIVGGTLGAVGLAAGLVSGDPNKALQYTSLGATTGYTLGRSTRDRVATAFKYEGITGSHTVKSLSKTAGQIRDEYRRTALSKDEYQAKRQQDYIDTYVKDHTEEFAQKNSISKRQAREALKEVAPDCIRNGIDDIDDINNIYDIRQQRAKWEAAKKADWEKRKAAGETVADDPIDDWRSRKAAGLETDEIPITGEIAMAATKLRNDYNINPSGMTKKTRQELNDTGITDEMIDVIKQVNTNKKKLE